jgi:CubicO group peptidase (beta-lactamase class C family)
MGMKDVRRMQCLSLALLVLGCSNPTFEVLPTEGLQGFAAELDELRVQLRIPAMSAAIVANGEIAWSRGFGYADLGEERQATPTTSFHLASLTKTFAATIVMQLVEQGMVGLDDPVSDYGVSLASSGTIRVRHLLNHTSENVPGAQYRYSGNRFGELDKVIEEASGRTFGELLVEQILVPLNLRNTAPNVEDRANFDLTGFDRQDFIANMATGYEVVDGEVKEKNYPTIFSTAAGLIASVEDMARYSIAIDEGQFLESETWEEVFTPAVSNGGETLPYGIGWFIQEYGGARLQWHYGWWTGNSSLIVRAPDQGLAFVVVANTDGLSSTYGLGGDNNALRSAFAQIFVESFVVGDELLPRN